MIYVLVTKLDSFDLFSVADLGSNSILEGFNIGQLTKRSSVEHNISASPAALSHLSTFMSTCL